MITKDQLIREYEARVRRGSLPGLLIMYALLVGAMFGTAYGVV